MKCKILIFLIFLFTQTIAQNNPSISWIKTYDTVNTPGVFLGEFSRDNYGNIYYHILSKWTKLDKDGNKVTDFVENTDSNVVIINSNIVIDSIQDVYISFTKKINTEFSIILKKYSSDGNELWSREYEGTYPAYLILDNKDFPILGYYNSPHINVTKFTSSGEILWSNSFEQFAGMSGLFKNKSNIYFFGWRYEGNLDPPDENHFLYKLDSLGKELWNRERTYQPICFDKYQNIIFRGKGDIIYKLDSDGNILWKNDEEIFASSHIKLDNNNDILVVGSDYDLLGTTGRNYKIKKYSEQGDFQWIGEFNSIELEYSNDQPLDFIIDSDNSIFITGRSVRGETYCYTLKYSEYGDQIYQLKLQDELNTSYSGKNIYFANDGFYIAGTNNNTIFLARIIDSSINDLFEITSSYTNYSLSQNYPNPFNPKTIIEYSISEKSNVKIEVFDLLGETVKILVNKLHDTGTYKVEFDGTNLPSGIYYYQIITENFHTVKKSILIK